MTQNAQTHEALPRSLTRGYAAFRDERLPQERERFRHLADEGQKPPTLLIGCCDSRVAPEAIFDVGPGELFVVRNVAALVPPYEKGAGLETSAAIEYAVIALKVAHIVVMGHAQCGGIRAFAQGTKNEFSPLTEADFVAKWKAFIGPAAEHAEPCHDDFDRYCENLGHASIIQGLENLRSYPWIREREQSGELSLHGASFGIADGSLLVLDQANKTFVPVAN